MDSRDTGGLVIKKQKHGVDLKTKRIIIIITLSVLICSSLISIIVLYQRSRSVAVSVPMKYAQQVLFNIYVPKKIPSGFSVNPRNFEIKDGDVLLFNIDNRSNISIIFAEQASPSGFNFDSFYQQYMDNIINLQGTPYRSVIGNVADSNRRLLSISANGTWILITAPRTVSTIDLQLIADTIIKERY